MPDVGVVAGVMTALLVLCPRRRWPAVLVILGSAVAAWSLAVGAAPVLAVGAAVAHGLASVVVAAVAGRDGDAAFEQVRTITRFGVAVVVGAAAAGVVVGMASVVAGQDEALAGAARWSLGEGLGILTTTPALVLLGRDRERRRRLFALEPALALASLLIVCSAVLEFGPIAAPWPYLVLGPMLWGALRFGVTGAAIGTLVLAQLVGLASANGLGPFSAPTWVEGNPLLAGQGFLAVIAISTLLVGARTQEGVHHARTARRARAEAEAIREVEGELRRSRSLQRVAGRLALVGGWAIDLATDRVAWSEELHHVLESGDALPPDLQAGLQLYEPADRARVVQAIDRCAADGTPLDLVVDMQTLAGRPIRARLVAEADPDGGDRPRRLIGALQDVTRQHRAEADVRALAERLGETLESITDGVFALDEDWCFTFLNSRAEQILKREASSLLGRSIWQEFPEAIGSRVDIAYRTAVAQGVTQVVEDFYYEPLDTWFTVHAYPSTTGMTAYFQDVTANKRLEAQLRRAQRLESIGTLAGGIAHDLNNVLTPIVMAADLLEQDPDRPPDPDLLRMIASNATRGADVVRQILTFAKGIDGARAPVDLGALVEDVAKIANDTFLKGITVTTEVRGDRRTALGDVTQLHQVLLNLCVNARDAMPQGGTIRIAIDDADDVLAADAEQGQSGPFLLVSVTDDGQGMSPEVLDHIWDPFFTTKGPGEGTGLGLSTSRGIVDSHGGFIEVQSRPGQGSTFTVFLPAHVGDAAGATGVRRSRAGAEGQGVVLVIDDEPLICDALVRLLRSNGFTPETAAGGAEALVRLGRPGPVDVVLTDLMMPEMDGVQTVTAIRRTHPELPIIAASGLHDGPRAQQVVAAGADVVLAKPFSTVELLEALHRVLPADG